MAFGLALLAVVALLTAWSWFLREASGRRSWSPLWLAFTATTVAVIFTLAGTIGYRLSRRARLVDGTAWSDRVIWWEIWVGLVAALVAAYFWRKALRSLRSA